MTAGTEPLTELPAWKALKAHYGNICNLHLRKLFAEDPKRGEQMSKEAAGIYLDYSKNRITAETLRLLLDLAEVVGLRARIDAMFRGEKINISEHRVCTDRTVQRTSEIRLSEHYRIQNPSLFNLHQRRAPWGVLFTTVSANAKYTRFTSRERATRWPTRRSQSVMWRQLRLESRQPSVPCHAACWAN